jgi:hypothetical protein
VLFAEVECGLDAVGIALQQQYRTPSPAPAPAAPRNFVAPSECLGTKIGMAMPDCNATFVTIVVTPNNGRLYMTQYGPFANINDCKVAANSEKVTTDIQSYCIDLGLGFRSVQPARA